MSAWYPIEVTQDDDGSFLLTAPDLPELATTSQKRARAFDQLREALIVTIGAYIERGRDVPLPREEHSDGATKIDVPLLLLLKLQLYSQMRRQNVSLTVLAARLQLQEDRVARLLRVEHNSQIDLLTDALHELGVEVSMSFRQIAKRGLR